MVVQSEEELLMADDLAAPCVPLHNLERFELLFCEVQAFPLDVFVARLPAEWSLFCESAAARPIHDPLEYAHVFAKAGPEEISFGILAKPIDVKNEGGLT